MRVCEEKKKQTKPTQPKPYMPMVKMLVLEFEIAHARNSLTILRIRVQRTSLAIARMNGEREVRLELECGAR